MAGGNYLQVAAANVRQAAKMMYRDVSNLRTSYTNREREIRRQIDELHRQVNQNNILMGGSNQDAQLRNRLLNQNREIQAEITNMQHQLVDLKRQTDSNVAGLERQIQSLNQEAGQLQNLATQS